MLDKVTSSEIKFKILYHITEKNPLKDLESVMILLKKKKKMLLNNIKNILNQGIFFQTIFF